jgi:CrcB protein
MVSFALVFVGGGCGSALRWALVLALKPLSLGFPVATLTINLLGCALIGLLAARLLPLGESTASTNAWSLLAVGVLGGFTTFSSFALETTDMLNQGRALHALAYVLLSNVAGIALAFGAFAMARPPIA